jgi:predicted ATP-dependent protease
LIEDREKINNFINDYGHQYGLNGRQIRNVVTGALASARNGAVKKKGNGKLSDKHLKEACQMTKDFQEQLKENTMAQRYNNEAR